MESLGIFEVKTHLSALIDRVEKGEEIVITRHGERVARIIPEKPKKPLSEKEADEIVERFKKMREGMTLGDISWKELRDEGRR
jgi:prevent-host-death family protein